MLILGPILLETSTNHRTNHALNSVSTSRLILKMARLQQTNTTYEELEKLEMF